MRFLLSAENIFGPRAQTLAFVHRLRIGGKNLNGLAGVSPTRPLKPSDTLNFDKSALFVLPDIHRRAAPSTGFVSYLNRCNKFK